MKNLVCTIHGLITSTEPNKSKLFLRKNASRILSSFVCIYSTAFMSVQKYYRNISFTAATQMACTWMSFNKNSVSLETLSLTKIWVLSLHCSTCNSKFSHIIWESSTVFITLMQNWQIEATKKMAHTVHAPIKQGSIPTWPLLFISVSAAW